MKPFPVQSWQQLSKQTPIFRKRFESYNEYGNTTIDQLLTDQEKEGVTEVMADYLYSSYIENLGDGKFEVRQLPLQAQVSPVNGINSGDFNKDGHLDIVLVGNDYGNEVNMGQYDAMVGLVLLGDGQGNFKPLNIMESGFLVDKDAKGLAKIISSDGKEILLATQNRGNLEAYSNADTSQKILSVNPDDFKVVFTYGDGKSQVIEIPYGAGFMTQSTRKMAVPHDVSKVEVINYKGESREVGNVNL